VRAGNMGEEVFRAEPAQARLGHLVYRGPYTHISGGRGRGFDSRRLHRLG
jgi:hypothetical protein